MPFLMAKSISSSVLVFPLYFKQDAASFRFDGGKGVFDLSKIPSPTSIAISSCPVSQWCAVLNGLGMMTWPLLDNLVVSID